MSDHKLVLIYHLCTEIHLTFTFTFIKLAIAPSQGKTYPRHCNEIKTY